MIMMRSGSFARLAKACGVPRAPGETARRDLLQLVADLHRHHAVKHEEQLVLVSVHVEIRSGRERRQLDLRKLEQAIGLAAGKTEERPFQRRTCMPLAGSKDKRRADGSS